MVCCSWDLIEEESMPAGVCVKVLDNPPISPKKMPKAHSPAKAITMMIPIFMGIVYNKIFMKRILFLVLWVVPIFVPQAQGAIEIYVNGHKYGSLQAYLASKKTTVAKISFKPVSLDSQQEDYIRKAAQQLGINVDFSKVKTFQVGQKSLTDRDLHKFYVLSVENGVVGALHDFYQNWGHPDFQTPNRISSEQLQEVIQQAVATSKDPKLLISELGKVRIMGLAVQDNSK